MEAAPPGRTDGLRGSRLQGDAERDAEGRGPSARRLESVDHRYQVRGYDPLDGGSADRGAGLADGGRAPRHPLPGILVTSAAATSARTLPRPAGGASARTTGSRCTRSEPAADRRPAAPA